MQQDVYEAFMPVHFQVGLRKGYITSENYFFCTIV
jgi:hypothetical protein